MAGIKYSKRQIEDLLDGIFKGDLSEYYLPDDLYIAIANYLKKGLYEGFGGTLSDFQAGSVNYDLLEELRTNIYAFSGAKTYQEMRSMVDLITDKDGAIRPFNQFRDDAMEVYNQYNVNWLETERATAIGQAANAAKWNDIEKNKKILPLLRYSAIEDANTSEICSPLDGVCLPVTDPFWDEFMPLNHFNCRCLVQQLSEDEGEITPPDDLADIASGPRSEISPLFQGNVGKDGMVFKKDHPYFTEIPEEDKAFAKHNFDLSIPDNDD